MSEQNSNISKEVFIKNKSIAFFLILIVIVITFMSFIPVLGNEFINWDNYSNLLNNPNVRGLNREYITHIIADIPLNSYIPLTILSYAIEYHFVGFNPYFYHLNNLLLHCLVVGLVFIFSRQCGLNTLGAAVAALLFGVHPLHVEPVAWITGRKDLLNAFFYLSCLVAYMSYLDSRKRFYYSLSLIFAVLSMLAKPNAISIPLILFLCDWLKNKRLTIEQFIVKIPFLMILVPIGWISYTRHVTHFQPLEPSSVLVFVWSLTFYIQKFIFFLPLNPVYTMPEPVTLLNAPYMLALIAFICCIGAAICFRRHRIFIFAFFYYLLSIIFVARFHKEIYFTTTVVADRYMYLSSVGFCILFGNVFTELYFQRGKRRGVFSKIFAGILFVFLVLSAVVSYRQCSVWKNSFTFWNKVIERNPRFANAYLNRGAAYFTNGYLESALDDFNTAIAIYPDYVNAYNNRGAVFGKRGEYKAALKSFNKAIKIEPENGKSFYWRSMVYRDLGGYSAALEDALRAASLGAPVNPGYIQELQKNVQERESLNVLTK